MWLPRAAAQAPGNHGQNQAESTVRLHVTHSNLKAEFTELRLDLHVRPPRCALSGALVVRCARVCAEGEVNVYAVTR
jgi:hypothetical protein